MAMGRGCSVKEETGKRRLGSLAVPLAFGKLEGHNWPENAIARGGILQRPNGQ